MKSLIELGAKGYFPLFSHDWIQLISQKKLKKLTGTERAKVKKIMQQLFQHRTLEKQRTVFHAMSPEDQEIFIKFFLHSVEGTLLNKGLELQ